MGKFSKQLHQKQSGFSLIVALLIMSMLAVIGVVAMKSGILSQKMASLDQEQSVVFQAAQSVNSAYITAYQYDINHLLQTSDTAYWPELTAPKQGYQQCIDDKGELMDCANGVTMEADKIIRAKVESFYHGCQTAALKCLGNSWDNSGLGCHEFQLIGEGHLDVDSNDAIDVRESKTHIEEWVNVIRSCNKVL